MSFLRPDDRSSRSRSKSATRDRSRSHSNARIPKAPSPPSGKQSLSRPGLSSISQPRSIPNGPGVLGNGSVSQDIPCYFPPQPNAIPYPLDDGEGFTMGGWMDLPPNERPRYVPAPNEQHYGGGEAPDDDLAYGGSITPIPESPKQPSYLSGYPQQMPNVASRSGIPSAAQYTYTPQPIPGNPQGLPYSINPNASTQAYKYALMPDKISYTAKPQTSQQPISFTDKPQQAKRQDLARTYSRDSGYSQDPRIVEITPDNFGPQSSNKPTNSRQSLSINTNQPASPSPGLGPRVSHLSVNGNKPDVNGFGKGGNLPPPSPLLEPYHGTYQSLSPMPGAMRLDDSDLDSIPPLSPGLSSVNPSDDRLARESKEKRRVKVYDPEADARILAKALSRSNINCDAICDVLPTLSHDQIYELHREYKKQVKIQGRGINLSKHIKLKTSGNFGKAAYVTALGRWESEGYWANFFYQSHSSRRELLIESLMGRTNAEIREIRGAFQDKRYGDSLATCMESELKMDKFRTAILWALKGERQEEQDRSTARNLQDDLAKLRSFIKDRSGETHMLEVIVRRSDRHIKELLRAYKAEYSHASRPEEGNFAQQALNKSNNLVGEVITHILNGVINKPLRDARLLRHAIEDVASKNREDELRFELLISRLVRLHWDRTHLVRVKREYHNRYGKYLEEEIEDATRGDFCEFLCELCQTSVPSR